MANRVLVTPRSMSRGESPPLRLLKEAGYEPVFPAPGRQPSEDELIAAREGVVGYVAGVEPITGRVLRSMKELRAISRNGVGIDNIDLSAAEELGIRVLKAQGSNARGVAELALLQMLLLKRKALPAMIELKKHNWEREKGGELPDVKLGIIGMGSIGVLVAELAKAFGMEVLGHDPYPSAKAKLTAPLVELDLLWEECEIITLHCPPQENGEPIVDRRRLESAQEGLLLINTARSSLVDDEAVLEALNSGKLGGYSVDAFAQEPPTDWRIVDHPKVAATPHIGGNTRESGGRAAEAAVRNLLEELKA